MGGIALDPKDIIAKLPPGFDYGAIDAALKTQEIQGLPDNIKQALQGVVNEHAASTILAHPPTPAASDVTAVVPAGEQAARDQAYEAEVKAAQAQWQQTHNVATIARPVAATLVDFAHDMTIGFSPTSDQMGVAPVDANDKRLYDSMMKPLLSVASMALQGKWIASALGMLSKAPMMTRVAESLPQRLADAMGSDAFKRIVSGAAIGGGIDVMRPDVPTATSVSPVDVSAWLGTKISEATGLNPRASLALGGAAAGGSFGEVIGGFLAGVQKARVLRAAISWSPEELASVRSALANSGIAVDQNATRYGVADQLFKNLRKIVLNENTAGLVSERLSREDHILNELFGSANSAQAEAPMPAVDVPPAVETSTQDLSRLLPVGEPGVRIEPAAPTSQILKVAARGPDGKPIGLLTLSKTGPSSADVFTVYVDPAFRRQGIATQLYDAAEASGLTLRSGQSGLSPEGRAFVEARQGAPIVTPQQQMANELLGQSAKAPPVGMVRLYHGGSDYKGGPRWLTPDQKYAEGYAAKSGGKVQYVDVPENSPYLKPISDVSGTNIKPTYSAFEAPPELARGLRPMIGPITQPTEEDARMIAGVFRTNPGGVTIVKGITSTDALEAAKAKLGIDLDHKVVIRPVITGDGNVKTAQFDVIIAKPNYNYPAAADLGSLNTKLTQRLKALSAEAVKDVTTPKTTEGFILSDGTPIKGGLRMNDLTKKLRLQQPMVGGVARPDLALKQASNYVRMELVGDKEFAIEIPTRLTQEQFNTIGRSFDAVQMNKVTIHAPDGTTAVLDTPLGAQVQSQIAKMVKPQSVTSSLTNEMVSQYSRTGVFKGQAAVLPDGTAAEVISKQGALRGQGAFYKVRESLTGQVLKVNEKNLTLLPTTLTSEYQPSQLFTQYLSGAERAALAKMRYGIAQGWAEPIQTNNDFKQFANSRGYNVEALRGGKVIIAKVNDGMAEPIQFDNIKSAIAFVRNDYTNLPDITPESIKNILGENVNLGWIGGSGHSPLQGEQIPISWPHLQEALDNMTNPRGTSLSERVLRPSRSMFEAIDAAHPGFQTRKMYENLQDGTVGMQNFIAKWRSGRGEALPDGVKSLDDIVKMAGPKPNTELIYSWNETPKNTPDAAALWAEMTPGEQKAALALKDWYRSAYTHFGVDAQFVEDYMPQYRQFKQQGNAGTLQDWWKLRGGDPLNPPKGMDWISEMERQGNMDVYEKDAFKVATAYLRGAAHTKFMKGPLDDANAMTQMIAAKNPGIASHIGHFVQALKGTEFPEQNAAIAETFHRMIEALPGEAKGEGARNLANGMVDLLNGAVYSSTQGFRPTLAFRNAADAFIMVWPVFGGNGRFSEALGKALSTAGRDEAIAARAISMSQGRRFDQPAVEEAIKRNIPEFIQGLNEQGMRMYDSADEFTRALAYHAAKQRAEDALTVFARDVKGASPAAVEAAKKRLMVESRMYLQDEQIGNEFLRRAANDPAKAAQFAGKQGADMTNFNYGRGMQPQWMRSVGGRLFGQFATWPIWYLDYLRRMVGRAGASGYSGEGMRLLAKHAMVNAAILYAGKQVFNIDMSKWASYGSLFWSGGPGFTVATGASTLMRGLGQVATGSEDPQAQSRVTEALGQMWNTLPAYVPLYFAGRDAINMTQATNGTELLAAALATHPTRTFTLQDRIDKLTGHNQPPFTSSGPALEDILNARALGKPTVDIRGVGQALGLSAGTGLQPGAESNPRAQSSSARSKVVQPLTGVPARTPPNTTSRIPESTPSKGF